MLLARIGNYVYQLAAVTQCAQFVEREERSTGEVRFHSQHAIEFDGMSDGFVNLQSELRAVENDVECAFGTLVGMMECYCFFRYAAGILQQLQFFDQLVPFVLPLSAIRIRIRPFLNLVAGKRICSVARTGGILGLMDVAALRRYEPLLLAIEVEVGFSQGDAGNG